MKADKAEQTRTFRPKPLTPEQLNAIDLLVTGQTDAEVCAAVGCGRTTLWEWRKIPLFQATLEQERQALFRAPIERLRGLASKAVDNITGAIEAGHIKWSFELLKCIGIYGALLPEQETDPDKLFEQMVQQELARSCLPGDFADLAEQVNNPTRYRRKREILQQLQRDFGEPDA